MAPRRLLPIGPEVGQWQEPVDREPLPRPFSFGEEDL
jgi:hypothetical protein